MHRKTARARHRVNRHVCVRARVAHDDNIVFHTLCSFRNSAYAIYVMRSLELVACLTLSNGRDDGWNIARRYRAPRARALVTEAFALTNLIFIADDEDSHRA